MNVARRAAVGPLHQRALRADDRGERPNRHRRARTISHPCSQQVASSTRSAMSWPMIDSLPTSRGERERANAPRAWLMSASLASGQLASAAQVSGSGRVGFGVAAALTPPSPASSSGTAGGVAVRAGSMAASFTLRCVFFDSRTLDYRHPVGHIHAHCAAPSAGSGHAPPSADRVRLGTLVRRP